jgi:hypothetical protein
MMGLQCLLFVVGFCRLTGKMTLRTAFTGLFCAGLATAVRYNANQVPLTKDGEEAAKNFPEVKQIDLQSPAFLDPKSIAAGFDNGTSGPTSDATLSMFPTHLQDLSTNIRRLLPRESCIPK